MLTTAQVAKRVGVHRDTLLRWLREKKIPEPGRDRHGWRAFTEGDAERIERLARASADLPLVSERTPEIHRLEEIDWDFADAKTNYLTHGLHPYPAKFIPQIPNALIQELSSVGETVADVFCGSGTTLVEALTLKRNAIGVDANPLACLISRAKTSHLTEEDFLCLTEVAEKSMRFSRAPENGERTLFPDLFLKSDGPRPDSERIAFWFEPFIIEELAEILSWCRELTSESARTVALASFSSIIVGVSKQDSDTRYVRREKQLRRGDGFKRFARTLIDSLHTCREFTELAEPRFTCRVLDSDVLSRPDIGTVDLVVCSPPYPNAYSYHLYHMTRMLWLGMDQPRFKQEEIGSHRKYSRKGACISVFRQEMQTVFAWLEGHLRQGRHACFVVGDSIINRVRFSNADIISEVASSTGFAEVARITRKMQDTRKAFNPAIGKIKAEQIVILKKRS